ncbi:MAG: DUF4349 domain-containing protein [Anaerolineales bacterium]|nr:DUF4349 domain-containing protein [Anaerolineales bacterium]
MKRILFISLAVILILSACGVAAAPTQPSFDLAGGAPAAPEMMFEAPMEAPAPAADFVSNAAGDGFEPAAVERLVIQNADLSIVVIDPEAKMDEIAKMAEGMGGFVVSKNVFQTTTGNNLKVPEGNITVRVPAENLEQALEQIKADAVEVQNENRSGQDVTREYVDLKSRLKTHEQAAEQLSEILEQKTESAEVIEVFNQLVYHREQIEILKGQINYYEEAAALSAISVRVTAEETLQPLEIAGWRPAGVARDALQALINFFQGFVNFLIWLIILIIPAALLLLGLLWVLWRLFRFVWRRLFKRKAQG